MEEEQRSDGEGDDDADVPAEGGDASVSNGCEPLAGLLLAIVGALVLHGYVSAVAWEASTPEGAVGASTIDLVEYAALNAFSLDGTPITFVIAPALMVLAYVLVAIVGPGDLIGRAGVRVLQALRITGLVVILNAVVATEALARRADRFGVVQADGSSSSEGLVTFLDRMALCLPLLAGTAAVVYVTWLANRLLTDDRDDEPAPTIGTTTSPN